MNASSKAVALGGIAVASWATVATAFKIALSHLSVYETIFIASITALAIFTVWLTIHRSWGELKKLSPRQWGVFALMGAINPTAYYLILFRAYDLLPAQIAQPINYVWPILLVILLAIFNRQPIPKLKYIGMAISLAGLIIISSGGKSISGGDLSSTGITLAILSAILWGVYWMFNDRMKHVVSESVSLFLGFLFGVIYLSVGALFLDNVHIDSMAGLYSGMYIGFFEIGVPFICFGLAIRTTDNPALINQMCYLAPFISLLLISTVLGEPIVATTYLGLLLIVAGIVYNQYFAVPSAGKRNSLQEGNSN